MALVRYAAWLCGGLLMLAGRPAATAAEGKPGAAEPKAATTPAAARATVEERLRGYERVLGEKDLRALGAGVDEVLVEIARDPKVEVLVRARAVSALAYCSTPAARKFLEQVIADKASAAEASERLLARKAAMALGWLGGSGVPATLARLLDHTDPDVRIDAALALGLTRTERAADVLRRRLPQESDARVRGQIGRQLRVIEAALGPKP